MSTIFIEFPRSRIVSRLIIAVIGLFAAVAMRWSLEMITAQEAGAPGEVAVSSETESCENEALSDSELPQIEPAEIGTEPPEQARNETESPQTVLPNLKEMEVSGPYCGIYALLACFDAFDVNPRLEELLVPEYVGSFEGSSNAELIAAAEKFGLHGKIDSLVRLLAISATIQLARLPSPGECLLRVRARGGRAIKNYFE